MTTHLPVLPSDAVSLPPLYAAWIEQFLGGAIPAEKNATCTQCAMLPDESAPSIGSGTYFAPDTKCCTYVPELPNFLVGRVLLDDSPAAQRGRETVLTRFRAGVGVTPLGFAQSAAFKLVFGNTISGFGHSRSLRCPHYLEDNGGMCGIWTHREATCTTWFCKHVRGSVGKAFWNRLYQLLHGVEVALARWCALELELDPAALRVLFPFRSPREREEAVAAHEIEGAADPAYHAAVWGAWAGREDEFYRRCAALVAPLRWDEVLARCGSEVAVYARLARAAFEQLTEGVALPERLTAGSFQLVGMTAQTWRVQTYSFLDPLDVPRPMMESLHLFDGRPTPDVLREMSARVGEEVQDAAIQMLVDFRILVPLEAPELPSVPSVP